MRRKPTRRTPLALGLISAAMLIFEITLTRIFAIQQFHHFAFIVVSFAVMGIAAGGTILTLSDGPPSLSHTAAGYAGLVGLSYLVVNYMPFDSFSIIADPRQIGILALYFLAAAAPFVLAGWTIAAGMAAAGSRAHLLYAANLVGSAAGCAAALFALDSLGEVGALGTAMALGFSSALFLAKGWKFRALALVSALIFLAVSLAPPEALQLRISPYKALSAARLAPDAIETYSEDGPGTKVTVLESGAIHVFPGLSLNAHGDLPPQAAVFIDGDGPIPITALDPEDARAVTIAPRMPATLAQSLRPGARTLILDPGAGLNAILALTSGASRVDMSVPEQLVAEILKGPYAGFSRQLLSDPRVGLIPRSDRGTLAVEGDLYDIVEFALSDPYRPVTSGAFTLSEDFALTRQSFQSALDNLRPGGLLVITRWLGTPPTESARAWATLLSALTARGIQPLGAHLVAYRGMRTATLMASPSPFSARDLTAIREFLSENAFDPIYLPNLRPEEVNQHNQLPEPTYYLLFHALLEHPRETLRDYAFDLSPPTDTHPYFFHFFRWRQIPAVVASLGTTWQPFGGSGYLVIIASLVLTILISVPLALAPALKHRRSRWTQSDQRRALAYFGLLGAAYLLIELPLIQRLTLLLDRPAWSLAAVLFTLLLGSGLGSLASPKLSLRATLAALGVLAALTASALPLVIDLALPWGLPVRLLLVIGFLSPLGFLMGVPFAAGLRHFQAEERDLIPWAWAMNGALSGISGVVAAMIALQWGFNATLALGAGAYVGAWLMVGKRTQSGAAKPAAG
jgi:hypothetical protein